MAIKANIFSSKGRKLKKKVSLPEEIFKVKPNKKLVAQAVRVYLANQRQGTASTKSRSEVRGSRRKIWRQKGTGRARHGDRYAPIFVGGGIAHGPKPRDFSLKMPQKMKRKALFGVLSFKLNQGDLLIVKNLKKIKPRTKEMLAVMKNLKLKTKNQKLKNRTLLVIPKKIEKIILAGRNLKNLEICSAQLLNSYQVLNCEKLVLMEEAIPVLKETFLKNDEEN